MYSCYTLTLQSAAGWSLQQLHRPEAKYELTAIQEPKVRGGRRNNQGQRFEGANDRAGRVFLDDEITFFVCVTLYSGRANMKMLVNLLRNLGY